MLAPKWPKNTAGSLPRTPPDAYCPAGKEVFVWERLLCFRKLAEGQLQGKVWNFSGVGPGSIQDRSGIDLGFLSAEPIRVDLGSMWTLFEREAHEASYKPLLNWWTDR